MPVEVGMQPAEAALLLARSGIGSTDSRQKSPGHEQLNNAAAVKPTTAVCRLTHRITRSTGATPSGSPPHHDHSRRVVTETE
jgi:hypothetical protein